MFFVKFDENGYISEFVEEKKEGFIVVPHLNCRLVNGTIVDESEKMNKIERIKQIKSQLESLSQDFIQYYLGATIENIEERKAKFISLHNELRELLGKQRRIYK